MNNPRIYIVVATFYPFVGGAETQAQVQGHSLCERGYETTIVTFRYNKHWPSCEVVAGVPVIRVAGIFLSKREQFPRLFQKLLYLLALLVMSWTLWQHRHRYDILHVYQLSFLTLLVALICRLTDKPMIIAVRSSGSDKERVSQDPPPMAAEPLNPITPWLRNEQRIWVDGDLEPVVRLGKPFVRLVRFLLIEIQAVVIVLSSQMKRYLAKHDFLLPNTQLIPNGVDISRFHPLKEHAVNSERSHAVICVCKFRYEKGIDVLLQAWRLVQIQLPQAHLILVGSGPLQQQLRHLAEILDITESVEFAGLHSNVPAQLHRAAIAVLPSRCEGMSNAILEAMACGLACVATRVSGNEDIIQHGANGLLVEPEDYDGLAQALLILLRNPALAQRYGEAARSTIEKKYALDHITDMYIELYQSILAHKGWVPERVSQSKSHPLSS